MVATVLRLRLRVLANSLAGHPGQAVALVLGALGTLGALGLIALALVGIGIAAPAAAPDAIIAGGALLVLGWLIAPVFVGGVDTTVDAPHLAQFPMSARRMAVAILAAAFIGVPGIASILGGLLTFVVWWRSPLASLAAVVFVPVALITAVVVSRAVTAMLAQVSGQRRTREMLGLAAFALLLLVGPVVLVATRLLANATSSADGLAQAADVIAAVAWTPLGAAWAVPADIAAEAWLPALGKAAVALVTLVASWALWRRTLLRTLTGAGSQRQTRVRAGGLGWLGRLPSGPVGATWARSLTYWLRDPRYTKQFIIVPFAPILVLIYAKGDATHVGLMFTAAIVAYGLALTPFTDISYDGTAFATILQTGIEGRADRLGRALATATVTLPLVLLAAVVTAAVTGSWALLPAALGAALGMTFAGLGVCAVASARVVLPVPAAGDNPYKRVPGATGSMMLVSLGCVAAGIGLSAPALVPAIIALVTANAALGWVSLANGVVYGLGVAVVGVRLGGRVLDSTGPLLLQRLRALKGV